GCRLTPASTFIGRLASETLTRRVVTRRRRSGGGRRAWNAPPPNAREANVHSPALLVIVGHDVLADEREVEHACCLDEMQAVCRKHCECPDATGVADTSSTEPPGVALDTQRVARDQPDGRRASRHRPAADPRGWAWGCIWRYVPQLG